MISFSAYLRDEWYVCVCVWFRGLRVHILWCFHWLQFCLGTKDLGPSKLNSYLGIFWCISVYKSVWVLASGLEISGEAFSPPAELVLGPCFLQSASDRQNVFYVTSFSGCDPLSVLDWCQVCCCVSISLFAWKSYSPFPPIPRPSLLLCEEIL